VDLFKYLGKLFEKKPGKRPYKRVVAVFIDNHNVENAELDNGVRYLVKWATLISDIKRRYLGSNAPIWASAYTREHGSEEVVERWKESALKYWANHGYQLHTYRKKDIDSLIVGDLWRSAALAAEANATDLHLVLVSGDGLFADTVKKIREQYQDRLRIKLNVYSWMPSLSWKLKAEARKGGVHDLTSLKNLVAKKTRVSNRRAS